MPQMARLESPGTLVHVIARGFNRGRIFVDDADRITFLARLQEGIARSKYRCLAWCLMNNHYHLLLRTSDLPMSRLMRPLNGAYARWFNHKYDRQGYLFQDRFRSVLCQDQTYARELIRYVHLNPIRAGIVKTLSGLAEWRWSGHAHLLGAPDAIGREFQDRSETLRRFGRTPEDATKGYLAFLAEGIDAEHPELSGHLPPTESFEFTGSGKGWPAVIGDPTFAQQAMERHRIASQRKHRQADYAQVLDKLANEVCGKLGIKSTDLMKRSRQSVRSEARSVFCFRAHIEELIPLSVIARYLHMTIPPVSVHVQRRREQPTSSSS